MRALAIGMVSLALVAYDSGKSSKSPAGMENAVPAPHRFTEALERLRKNPDNDAFLIFEEAGKPKHYLQFAVADGVCVFDRPVLTEGLTGLPLKEARLYVPVETRPVIEPSTTETYLTPEEADRAESYFAKWGLASTRRYEATEEPKGKIVEFFESFHGKLEVSDDRFTEFVTNFFEEVYGSERADLKLNIKER